MKLIFFALLPFLGIFSSCQSDSNGESLTLHNDYTTDKANVHEEITFENGQVITSKYYDYSEFEIDGIHADTLIGTKDSEGKRNGLWQFYFQEKVIGEYTYENGKLIESKKYIDGHEYDSLSGFLDNNHKSGIWKYFFNDHEVGKREYYSDRIVEYPLQYKKYESDLDFSIKVPLNWTVEENGNQILFKEINNETGNYKESLTVELLNSGLDHEKLFNRTAGLYIKRYRTCTPEDLGNVNYWIYYDSNREGLRFYQEYYTTKENGIEIIIRLLVYRKSNSKGEAFMLEFKTEKSQFKKYGIHLDKMNDSFDY